MLTKKIALAGFVCLTILSGCTTPAGKSLAAGSCLMPETEVETCVPRGNKLVCPVYVFSTPSGAVVFPYKVKVPPNKKATIVWHLLEPKARFLRDDGPQELKNNAEFEDGSPSDDDDGASDSGNSGRKYKFHYKNNAQSTTHSYTIAYRSANNQVVRCDPKITNNAD